MGLDWIVDEHLYEKIPKKQELCLCTIFRFPYLYPFQASSISIIILVLTVEGSGVLCFLILGITDHLHMTS